MAGPLEGWGDGGVSTDMDEHAVVIVGAGPAGMMLAAELTLAGADVVVLERRATADLESPRARGLHSRTIEVLDQRGIAERFLAEGQAMQVQAFAGVPLDISDFPSRHPYGLALLQSHFERILAGWIDELGVRVLREREVAQITQHDDHVLVELVDGALLRAQYLVGCDGGRSTVRKQAGIEFAGWDATTCWITTEVEVTDMPPFGLRGGGGVGPAENGRVGVTLVEPDLSRRDAEPTIDDVRAALVRVDGTDYGAHTPRYVSRFTDVTRQAVSYRSGRVLLAGDSAHVHAPLGGQGLNLGVQDAVNLGWKLAQVVSGSSPDALLDSYHAERHPVAARVLDNTMAQRALGAADDRSGALRGFVTELLAMDEPRRHTAAMISGLDIAYDLGDGHLLLGRRAPDLDLVTADGPRRLYEYLHDARAALVVLGDGSGVNVDGGDRLQVVEASYPGAWELPVVGAVPAPAALLVRPDGYVAWVGDRTDTGLAAALSTWCGL